MQLISLLAALILSLIIFEGSVHMPVFILLVALGTIPVVILTAGPSTGVSSFRFKEFHGNS